MLLRSYALTILASLCLVGNAHALADFTSLDGSLQFKNFVLSDDESFYTFEAIDYGFRIIMEDGALSRGDVNVAYDVISNGAPITGASLGLTIGSVTGASPCCALPPGGFANVSEDYFALPKDPQDSPMLRLTAHWPPFGPGQFDSGTFDPVNQLRADKDILLINAGDYNIAYVTQTYQVAVPEPTALMVFGLGASMMGFTISRRQCRAD